MNYLPQLLDSSLNSATAIRRPRYFRKQVANENLLANKANKGIDSFNLNHNLNYGDKRNVTIKNSNVTSKSAQAANTNLNNQSLQLYHQETLPEQSINQSMLSNSTESLTIVDHNKPMVKCSIHSLNFDALLDACSSGPEGYIVNYIHPDAVIKIKDHQKKTKKSIMHRCSCSRASTCTAAGCFETSTCISLDVQIYDATYKSMTYRLSFRISKGINPEIIIGNHTFRSLDLSRHFRHLFAPIPKNTCIESISEENLDNFHSSPEQHDVESTGSTKTPEKRIDGSLRRSERLRHTENLQSSAMDSLVEGMNEKSLGTLWLNNITLLKEDVFTFDPEDSFEKDIPSNPIEDILNNTSIGWDSQSVEQKINEVLKTVYDKELRIKISPILRDFIDIFRKELPSEPAKIEPMKLKLIENSDWYINRRNKQAPRLQIIAKQYALRKFILKAIANGLIRPSNAISWSHPHLTMKPSGEYRVCMDWKSLNQETLMNGWPLLNIKDIIHRLGEKRANYFAVIDLTQGYWQIPIHEDSQHLTAFRTAEGLYEWTRLGMGLKGAAPYFQYHMANTIFPDLIYKILEVYLDDIITWGETQEELIQNLTQIFSKLRKFGIFINPDKIKIGLSEIEYVGHTIDRYGEKFSQKKQDQVLNFKKPINVKDMKSFLGVIGQFREHVDHFSDLTSPLYEIVENYQSSKNNKINWTPKLEEIYEDVKQKVANCPKLFFINEQDPIFLSTDASNIGIGAYLYQETDTRKHPIRFISKALSKVERRWDTVEKEAYAIFYALKKLKYLLHDKSFIIRTDSKNLSYMNAENKSQKVQRWKLHCQEFDFKVEHSWRRQYRSRWIFKTSFTSRRRRRV